MNLSENLKKIRKDNNLSQEDLAEKLGVSRQSVSKWEQGLAYPEMDKVLEICKLFNLNIDDLLNQDIKEVEKTKQSKSTVNKNIDSFLSYISKTVNLFSSMKFKNKIKCLFEQLVIISVLCFFFLIIGGIFDYILSSMLSSISYKIYHIVNNVFEGIYILFALVASIVIILHIFKVRYLDYYVVVDKENKEDKEDTQEKEDEVEEIKTDKEVKKKFERKEEKIIIRDPNHSGYRFINGLVKVILFFIKCFVGLIGIGFSISLIFFVACLVLSFLVSNSGMLFTGLLLGILSCIFINLIVLDLIINFIANRKIKKGLLIATFLISLITAGISCGLVLSSYKDFKVIKEYNNKYYQTYETSYKMNKDFIIAHYDVEYIESDNNNIKVEYRYPNYCSIDFYSNIEGIIHPYTYCLENPNNFKNFLRNLNDKVFVYDNLSVKVYTNKDNIKTLKNNNRSYYNYSTDYD